MGRQFTGASSKQQSFHSIKVDSPRRIHLALVSLSQIQYELLWVVSRSHDSRVQSASITLTEPLGRNAGGSHHGAVAQLGERLICIQEVAGSIPTSSTMLTSGRFLTRATWACSSVG
jgi:hypothetical protein